MTVITLCCKLSGKSSRHRLENVDLSLKVKCIRENFAEVMNVAPQAFDLIYGSQLLRDDQPLDSYGIKPGVTVYAVKALHTNKEASEPEPMDDDAVQQVVTALQTALINPAFRNIVEKMLTDTETMENLVIAVPELDEDPVAIAMLQDPELLAMLADPKQIKQVIEAHPCLGQAALYVTAAVSEEGAKMDAAGQASSGSYSLDRMSDDDDDDELPRPQRTGGRPMGNEITANQLAAALAAASGATPSQPSTSGESGVSLDFLQQAMMHAQTSLQGGESQESSQSSSSNPASRPSIEAQLQQMRDMGITDESVARRALDAAGGNVQAALEFIFGDGAD